MYAKIYFKLDDDVTEKVINVLAAEVGEIRSPNLWCTFLWSFKSFNSFF